MKAVYKYTLLTMLLMQVIVLQAQTNQPNGTASPPGTVTTITLPDAYNAGGNTAPTRFNYVQNWLPYRPLTDTGMVTYGSLISPSPMATMYSDGMGRPLQAVVHGAHLYKDVVVPYDNRPSLTHTSFMPYIGTGHKMQFQLSPFGDQQAFFQGSGYYPNEGGTSYSRQSISYTTHVPITKSYAPGASFTGQGRCDSITATIDTSNAIHMYYTDDNGNLQGFGVYYPPMQLTVHTSFAPGGAMKRSYTDKTGRTVCVQQLAAIRTWLTTYNVYNDEGRLAWIIPAKVNNDFTITASTWNTAKTYCYNYIYDQFGHIIARQVPGRNGNEYIVYDALNRPVLRQTPLQLTLGQWQFNIYDNQNRVVMSGLITDTTTQPTWQALLNSSLSPNTSAPYYALSSWLMSGFAGTYPTTIAHCTLQNFNYYDTYSWSTTFSSRSFDSSMKSNFLTTEDAVWPVPYPLTQGRLTASKVLVQDATGAIPTPWITTVYFYDQKGRPIQVQTQNPFGSTTWDQLTTQYNFTGQKILDINQHYAWSAADKASTQVVNWYIYDDYYARLTNIKQKTDAATTWRDITTFAYDGLGRLQSDNLGGVEQQDLQYNIRGQLSSINSDYLENPTAFTNKTFGDSLSYDYGFSQPRYDGMISGMQWRGAQTSVNQNAYGYRYDLANRLTNADFVQYTGSAWSNSTTDYSMGTASYDAGGNILALSHKAPIPTKGIKTIDALTYTYAADSKLQKVSDTAKTNYLLGDFQDGTNTGNDYSYDNDGNLVSDSNKHISSITYNELDVPTAVTTSSGTITNSYDADGNLLQKIIATPGHNDTLRYWGPFTYRNDSLLYMAHASGRARYEADSSMFKYDFFVTDHLGNVRTLVTSDLSPNPLNYFASNELASAALESTIFASLVNVRDNRPYGGAGDAYAADLNGSDSTRRIGAAMLLKVMPGDRFDISAKSYYDTTGPIVAGGTSMLSSIISTLIGQSGGYNSGDNPGTYVNNLFTNTNYIGIYDALKNSVMDTTIPPAYINYLVFDNSMNLVSSQSGVVQIGATPGTWQTIGTTNPVTIGQTGYITIYLSNEGAHNAYFDNLSINHYQGRVLQVQDYYPYGLAINQGETTGPDNLHSAFKFETNEIHDELGLNLADFNARQYDYQIGRFTAIDPLADGMANMSPYNFAANNPANLTDPWGLSPGGGGGNYAAPQPAVPLQGVTVTGERLAKFKANSNEWMTVTYSPSQFEKNNHLAPIPMNNAVGGGGGSDGGTPADISTDIDPLSMHPMQPLQVNVPPETLQPVAAASMPAINMPTSIASLAAQDYHLGYSAAAFYGGGMALWNTVTSLFDPATYKAMADNLTTPVSVMLLRMMQAAPQKIQQFQNADPLSQSYMMGYGLATVGTMAVAPEEGAVVEGADVARVAEVAEEASVVAKNGSTAANRLGQDMHRAYKADVEDKMATFKEFNGVPGVRPDFVDFNTSTIYELKPNNPRAIRQGTRQLQKYKAAYEQHYPGTSWNIVLDTY